MSILTMKTVRMVKCMEITGLPREATISTVLRAWQNYRANYNKNHKSHPLTGKLKSAWLKLFLMAVSWGFVTLQQRLIWGKHIELSWPGIPYKPQTFSSAFLLRFGHSLWICGAYASNGFLFPQCRLQIPGTLGMAGRLLRKTFPISQNRRKRLKTST